MYRFCFHSVELIFEIREVNDGSNDDGNFNFTNVLLNLCSHCCSFVFPYLRRPKSMIHFRYFLVVLSLCCSAFWVMGQQMIITGSVYDSLNFRPVRDAQITVDQFPDSLNSVSTKADYRGDFQVNFPMTAKLRIWITHPNYNDTTFLVSNATESTDLKLGKIILSENSLTFSDVEIVAVLPVSFKGDTVVFAADSFPVRPNAKVEDLLRSLPGVEINEEGKFVVNGRVVDRILIDGEEFLSADVNATTKNINAKIIESVQVYEEQTRDKTRNDSTEKVQVINLKIKKEAKNSVASDITLGTDFQQFFDNHIFATRFKDKRKIALQAKHFNTENQGIMRNTRGKIELSIQDQLTEKLSINAKYNLDYLRGKSDEEIFKQYLFEDSTFTVQEQNSRLNGNLNNGLSTTLTYQHDTLTKIIFKTEFKQTKTEKERAVAGLFFNDQEAIFGDSWLSSSELGTKNELIHETDFTRKFKKDRRLFSVSQRFNISSDGIDNSLIIENNNENNPEDSIRVNQIKNQRHNSWGNVIRARYTEPISTHWTAELSYFLNYNESVRKVESLDRDAFGEYSIFNQEFSNNFRNNSANHVGGLLFLYEKGNHQVRLNSQFSNIQLYNRNLSNSDVFERSLNNLQGKIQYTYKVEKEFHLSGNLNTHTQIPSILQFQPVPDNSNPNQIFIGNPNLKPAIVNELRFDMRKWNPGRSKNVNLRLFANLTLNDISTATNFNASGQNVVQNINIDQAYRTGYGFNVGFPLIEKRLTLRLNQDASVVSRQNFINNQRNESLAMNQSGTVSLKYDNKTNVDSELSFRTNYTQTRNTISIFTRPSFWSFKLEYEINIRLPQKFIVSSQLNGYYLTNTRIANANYLIWNAQVKRKFLKGEQLTAVISVRDILNQTAGISRTISANIITDSNAELIARYFMFSLTYNLQHNIKR